eukprot:1139962-Pelagomonas_calceolata.AAC.3
MLFILDIIISLTKVTAWGRAVIPSCCLIAKDVSAESKLSHVGNDIMGEPPQYKDILHHLLTIIWATGVTPKVWKVSDTFLIHKHICPAPKPS